MVSAPANRVVCGGQPYFVSGFLGEQTKEGCVAVDRSRSSPSSRGSTTACRWTTATTRSSARPRRGRNDEFDRPTTGDGEQNYTYTGAGGVEIGSFGRKLLYAISEQETNFLLSDRVNEESKLLYVRNPRDRVEKVAPFLTVDGDPYPAIVDGRIKWIIDGYTTAVELPVRRAHQPAGGDDRRAHRPGHVPARPGERQLHPQLGQGHRRRVRRHGDPLRVRRVRPGAQGLEQGLRRRPGDAQERDPGRADGALPLPGRPVQGPAQPAHQVPRHRRRRVLLRAGLLGGPEHPGRAGQRAEAAAVLPLHPAAGAGRGALPAHLVGHPGRPAEPRRADLRLVHQRRAAAAGARPAATRPRSPGRCRCTRR